MVPDIGTRQPQREKPLPQIPPLSSFLQDSELEIERSINEMDKVDYFTFPALPHN